MFFNLSVNLLRSVILTIMAFIFFHANVRGQVIKTQADSLPAALPKDSALRINPVAAETKLGFKDLFGTPTAINGINVEQLNPQVYGFVADYIQKNGKMLEDMKGWGKPYFDMMDVILIQHGVPKELKYLAVIESHLKSSVRSWAGAVGPWQFMPATARNFGLRVSRHFDERTDYFKSTHAASRYLTELFAMYGDWLLVIAAFNGGPGNVNNAIKKSGSRDFWVLQNFLPAQSRNHVKKFIATHYIMEGQGSIATATKNEAASLLTDPNRAVNRISIPGASHLMLSGRYNSRVIVKYISMEIDLFNKMNPDFDKLMAAGSNYEMLLPGDKMEIFNTRKYEILEESIRLLLQPQGRQEKDTLP